MLRGRFWLFPNAAITNQARAPDDEVGWAMWRCLALACTAFAAAEGMVTNVASGRLRSAIVLGGDGDEVRTSSPTIGH